VGEAFQIIFELAVILAESVAGEKRKGGRGDAETRGRGDAARD
jgi:hypothetical protein